MLNFHSRRWETLFDRSICNQSHINTVRHRPLPGLLYLEPRRTLAALAALRLAGLGHGGLWTHSGRTLSRVSGGAPRLPAIRLERCWGGRRAFGTGSRALGQVRQRGNGIPLKIDTAVDTLPLRWVPCCPKPKQRDRRRVAVFCLALDWVGRICFFVDDGGAKCWEAIGLRWRSLCAAADTAHLRAACTPLGAANRHYANDSLRDGSLLGRAIFVSVGLVRRNAGGRAWPRRVD